MPTSTKKLKQLLKQHFGYDSFRPMQEEIIHSVLNKQDTLVLMPTGGGKSLCYQLPALALPGVTLVVSPLIALMKDQVDALKTNGIEAAYLNSTLDPRERDQVMLRVQSGEIKILYIAPERLATQSFRLWLKELDLSLIAIDEAHCISEWGHDFRPDYRNLDMFRIAFSKVPVVALTATATERVRDDIMRQLKLKDPAVFTSSFNRPNLSYHVMQRQRGFDQLLSVLDKHRDEPVIIYCFSRKHTENIAADLNAAGHRALPYHAGLNPTVRQRTQDQFIRDEVPIIVATIAFGMGIDKPDIRLVVHYHLPKTLEGYYQETGRAGRDNLPSDCVLLYSYADKRKHQFFIDKIDNGNEKNRALEKMDQVISFCELTDCRRKFILEYFGEAWEEDTCETCDACLNPVEEFDATLLAQKILSAILRTGERFGSTHVARVLRGSRSKAVLSQGHDSLSVYNIVNEYKVKALTGIMRQLVMKGFLEEDVQYKSLRVTSKGKRFLKEKWELQLPQKHQKTAIQARKASSLDFDAGLYEKLRIVRKALADENGVPPFMVVGNATLMEMAYYIPQDKKALIKMSGIGKEKLSRFGDAFLQAIISYAKDHGLESTVKTGATGQTSVRPKRIRASSTYTHTKQLLQEKKTLEQIASERKLKPTTIMSHIEALLQAGEDLDLSHLRPEASTYDAIATAFEELGTERLTPVKEKVGDDVSWEELKLVRLFMTQG